MTGGTQHNQIIGIVIPTINMLSVMVHMQVIGTLTTSATIFFDSK